MNIEEFEKIIRPLNLLGEVESKFMIDALKGNFDRWHKSKAENLLISNVRLSLPDANHVLEYTILLRQALYAGGQVKTMAIRKLDGYGTPIVKLEDAISNEA